MFEEKKKNNPFLMFYILTDCGTHLWYAVWMQRTITYIIMRMLYGVLAILSRQGWVMLGTVFRSGVTPPRKLVIRCKPIIRGTTAKPGTSTPREESVTYDG